MQLLQKLQNYAYRMLFTKRERSGDTAPLVAPLLIESSTAKLFLSITDLPLSNFIACEVDEDYTKLVKSGTASESELLGAWMDIKQQYMEALGHPGAAKYFEQYKKFMRLQTQYTCALHIIDVLSKFYVKEFETELEDILHVKLKLDPSDLTKYFTTLKRAGNLIQGLKIKLEVIKQKIEAATEAGDSKKPTREYFQTCLIAISDFVKYRISDEISTFEYCKRVKDLNAAARKMETNKLFKKR